MNIRLFSDSTTNIHVDLPSGKISKKGFRKTLNRQKGLACTLFAMRRIAIFNTEDKECKARNAYKLIKNFLMKFGSSKPDLLIIVATKIFNDFDIEIEREILKNKSFMERYSRIKSTHSFSPINLFNRLDSFKKWVVIYDILIEKVLAPLMNLNDTNWHPRDGIDALKASLKQNGAHFFMGKFGSWCYTKPALKFISECTPNRRIFYFDKDAYIGDVLPFTHGIIVDQIKTVKGREMVFFRDPNNQSKEGQPEIIYMLSYDTFIQRLTDRQGYRIFHNECASDITFGMISSCPEKLYSHATCV